MNATEDNPERERKRVMERCLLVEDTVGHPNTVLKGLNRLRLSRELCDVVLCCGGQEFPCHRAVLASFSSYFQAMFTSGMLESRQDRVNIHGVEAHIMDLLLTFAYTSEVAIPKEHVQDVLAAAQMLDVKAVLEKCCYQPLDINNCLRLNIFAEAHSVGHSVGEMERCSLLYIIEHFGDVYMQEEFPSLPVDTVTKILSDKDLNVPKEEAVFEAAMLWINKCPTRRQHFEKFLELIRLPLISPSYLHNAIESLELVKESPYCQRLISEAMEQHHLPYSKTVHPRRTEEVMVLVGGQSNGKLLYRVECLSASCLEVKPIHKNLARLPLEKPARLPFKNLARLPFKVHKHGLAVSGTALYVAGGEQHPTIDADDLYLDLYEEELPHGSVSKKLWRYDPLHDYSWTEMASMNEARCDFGLVELDGYLWAVGGQDCSGCFVERYDPRTNTWELREDMPRCNNHPVVVTLDGLIYVFGRREEAASQRALEQSLVESPDSDLWLESTVAYYEGFMRPAEAYKYNPKTTEWTEVAPLLHSASAACTLNGKIYVIGGEKVERYDPTTNQWTMSVRELSMSIVHQCRDIGVVAMNGKIYVLGGKVFGGEDVRVIQEYCDQTDKWASLCELPDYNRPGFGYSERWRQPTYRVFPAVSLSCVSLWLRVRDVQ